MPGLVTAGAVLRCTYGSATRALLVPTSRGVTAGGNAVATITDNKPYQNIPTFGQCASTSNPGAYAGAGSPNRQGPPACTPSILSPWSSGSTSVNAGGLPVLTTASQCHCQFGGTISVISPGELTVTVY